jgi:5-methylcytosine-specific restriction endonuclease McrA
MNTKAYGLAHLGDNALLEGLAKLHHESRQTTALLIAHLAEVDTRKLYLRFGFSSLFAYCLEKLGCTEDEAGRRIHAARIARRFPVIFERIARGELHLSTVNLLAPHLTENHADSEALLEAACNKTKREVEYLVASRFPKADVQEQLRRLPLDSTRQHVHSDVKALPIATTPAQRDGAQESPEASQVSVSQSATWPAKQRDVLAPLSSHSYKLQVTLSQRGYDLLLRARELQSNKAKNETLACAIERGLELLCAKLETRKFGKRKRNKDACKNTPQHVPGRTRAREEKNETPREPRCVQQKEIRSRTIPRVVRREVAERDQYCCAYVGLDGRRCSERKNLEYHHVRPFARGGTSTVDGLMLLCRAHNDLLAREDFGEQHMAWVKAQAQHAKTLRTT